jgi:predicted aspartyl protease
MGKIIEDVTVSNVSDKDSKITFDALVDTGATFLTLPNAWRAKLGELETLEEVELEMASGQLIEGEICGPVRIKIGEFRQIIGEVLFMEMESDADGNFEPLIGYLPLEAIPAGVDMLNHRLFKVKAIVK